MNAIAVWRESGERVGYLPADLAAEMAPILDAYGTAISAQVRAIVGGPPPEQYWGLRIVFEVPELD